MTEHTNSKSRRGIYLVGFSGSGKSTIAKRLADRLHCQACDLDDLIVERSGTPIWDIFKQEGEQGFRVREMDALIAASEAGAFVIATGGGTIVRAENRNLMTTRGWVIFLEAQPSVLHARIQQQLKDADPRAIRPLLDAVYPLDQIRSLKHTRQPIYGLADWTVHTDRLTEEQVVDEVIRAVEILENSKEPLVSQDTGGSMRHSLDPDLPPPIVVSAGLWPYQVIVGWDNLGSVADQIKRVLPQAKHVAILTEHSVWRRVGASLQPCLTAAGFTVNVREIADDESVKSMNEVSAIHDWLAGIRFRRDDVLMIVGGGAIDDVGSFAASTYMRGVPLVKVPSSLEGMVDTSIGGKTALNHPTARNLIGTFYHPRLVWTDASLLRVGSVENVRPAWAEVIKYAMLEGSLLRDEISGMKLFDVVSANVQQLLALEKRVLLDIIARCVALKAQVVASDERDFGQHRILLNYGHTIGHALETSTDYAVPHGNAVAIGMTIEAAISVRLGVARPEVAIHQNELLTRFGLPTKLPAVSIKLLLERIRSDKKVFGDSPRWILPVEVGRAIVSSSVSSDDLISVIQEFSSSSASSV
jgi:shikimate kinase / 3-dehydroquinate synthase